MGDSAYMETMYFDPCGLGIHLLKVLFHSLHLLATLRVFSDQLLAYN
jgi:hypothetical protein